MNTPRLTRQRSYLRKLHARLAECSRSPERVLFLDVETTGLDPYCDEITVIGWSFGGRAKTIVKGMCAAPLRDDLRLARCLVTFNGGRFDTKFVTREFPHMTLPRIHIDLLHLCRRVGLRGGQKAIERTLGIDVRGDAVTINGGTAVWLWRKYTQGDRKALRRLIHYNRVDVAALGAILDEVIRRMNTRLESSTNDVRFGDWSAPPGWRMLPSHEFAGGPPS